MNRKLAFLGLVFASTLGAQDTHGWPVSTFAAEGLSPVAILAIVERAKTRALGNVDRIVVIRNGKLIVNETFPRDYKEISRGKRLPIGCGTDACTDSSEVHQFNYLHPEFHPWWHGSDLHTLQSVTKSVTATLFGVALERGEMKDVTSPLLSYFDGYDLSKVDPRLRKASLADLLTMRSGIEWHENDRPLDSTNTTLLLEGSKDWIRFTLSQPMDTVPGTKWVYNSGGSALMAEVLRRVTGMHVDEYAKRYLFGPLGITSFAWKKTPTGHPDTEGGLYLATLDLAKIGQLYLDDGVWRGTRILKAGWAADATTKRVERTNPTNVNAPGYGYQWWRQDRRGEDIWVGNGFGGQFLIVIPSKRVVAVANSWNVFGTPAAGILNPLIDALLDSAQ